MIDLHCHSIFSDGDLSPNELLKKAEQLQLSYFSITDHNNCRAYNNLDISNYSGVLIPGVEMVTSFENHIVEILGYGVDTNKINEWYEKNIERYTNNSEIVYNKLIDIFIKNRIKYTPIDKRKVISEGKPKQYFYNDLLKYEENYKIIGYDTLKTFSNFMKQGLNNPKSILFMNECERFPKLKDVVDLIHSSNGLCFLAHVYQYNVNEHYEFIEKILNEVKLDGLEVYHSSFSEEQINKLSQYADFKELYKCGGSDFHGELKKGIEMGNGLKISEEIIKPWIAKIETIKGEK